jgi:hypothetical protein
MTLPTKLMINLLGIRCLYGIQHFFTVSRKPVMGIKEYSYLKQNRVYKPYRFVAGHYPTSCLLFKTIHGQRWYIPGDTLRLRYESNRLMSSACLWRRYINIIITVLGIIHRSLFYLKRSFEDWILSPSSNGTDWVRRRRQGQVYALHQKTETEFIAQNFVLNKRQGDG